MEVKVTQRQLDMIRHKAKVLYIGAGTKTGKTVGLACWIAEGIMLGQHTAWVGSVSDNTRKVYSFLKRMLDHYYREGLIKYNDTSMKIECTKNGGSFDAYTGVDPQPIFGNSFHRVVIDEASRQSEMSLTAALTTVSVTDGQVKLAFNLEMGTANWAIKDLVKVKDHMTEAEREEQGVDFMLFPTMDEEFVKPEVVERMKSKMPTAMYEALYLAIIPNADYSLFRNLDDIFQEPELQQGPKPGHTYVQGVDLARKRDWTVPTVIDVTVHQVVDTDRFHLVSWNAQYDKIAAQYHKWKYAGSLVDQTGVGDPVVEELAKKRMNVQGYMIGPKSRKDLLERLIVACDGIKFRAPATPRFAQMKAELKSFEYVAVETKNGIGDITYKVPSGYNDDCAFSLALAEWAAEAGNFGSPTIQRIRDEEEDMAMDFRVY